MTLDRAELAGTGIAIVFHAGLIAALSMSLAGVTRPPEQPALEVELVEEVALAAAAPTPALSPPAEQAPAVEEVAQPEPPAPPPKAEPLPPPPPKVEPVPPPRPVEKAAPPPRPVEKAAPPPKPVEKAAPPPPRTAAVAQPKAAPQPVPAAQPRPAPRTPRIGDDFLKGIAEAPQPASAPSAPVFSAAARASVTQAIRRQIQPCADQQVNPGPGANRISVTLNLRLSRGGRLIQPPQIVRTSGVDDENGRFEDRVKDLAVAAYVGCSPLTGLPQDLYQTPEGGWSNINMTYRLP